MQITGTFSFMRNEVKPLYKINSKYANLHFIELFLHICDSDGQRQRVQASQLHIGKL